MRFHPITFLFGAALLALCPSVAQAQSNTSMTVSGTSAAEVIQPSRLMKLADLRFGAFVRPSVASNLIIATSGTATGSGDIATSMNIAQPSSGRGPAVFRIESTANRSVLVQIPTQINISNGSATMRVDNFTTNLPGNPDANGIFLLRIGARLRAAAGQAPGNYTGVLTITAIFL